MKHLALTVSLLAAFCCGARHCSFQGGYPSGAAPREIGASAGVGTVGEKKPAKTVVVRKTVVNTLRGRVVLVSDGNSITIAAPDGKRHEILLYGIDAPELGQPWGTESKMALNRKVFGKTVSVEIRGLEGEKRIVGVVLLGKEDICRWMLSEGNAWWRKQTAKTETKWGDLEKAAREGKRGLWAKAGPVTPNEWRKNRK